MLERTEAGYMKELIALNFPFIYSGGMWVD